MIRFNLRITVSCDNNCGASFEHEAPVTAWQLRRLLENDDALEVEQLPTDWGYHTTGGWGMTNYTKTQLLCAKCIAKWDHGTTRWGTNGPLTQIANAAKEARP